MAKLGVFVNSKIHLGKVKLFSADRDLIPAETEQLNLSYNAIAGDWESGAILVMSKLLDQLPAWIEFIENNRHY